MGPSQRKREPIRAPKQNRSQVRVQRVLNAAETLIEQHGCAGLRMSDIAVTADITISSIYQYFPNTDSIVRALTKQFLDANFTEVQAALSAPINNLDEIVQTNCHLLDVYYRLRINSPVLAHIWLGHPTVNACRTTAISDQERVLKLLFEHTYHLFPPRNYDALKRSLHLFVRFSEIAIESAMETDEATGRALVEDAKELLSSAWQQRVKKLTE